MEEMQAADLTLQAGGKQTLVGLCPFHQDHSPSLWVNPESGLWGCNKPTCPAAGIHDVINFRALIRNISNSAAIKQLANEFLKTNSE
jgi:DNA primase